MEVPKFANLPSIPGRPTHCSWDVWNSIYQQKTGKERGKDWIGTLNHLTPEVVAAAAKEIQTGDRVSLNWPLDAYTYVGFARKKLEFNIIDGKEITGGRFLANDDQISFNTQISTQWDGLCHFGHTGTSLYYNGATHEECQSGRQGRPGSVHEWSNIGGVCGRGVLLDYHAYAQKHGINYSPGDTHVISVSTLDKVAAWEGIDFRPGDILLIRTGWTSWHDSLSGDEAQKTALTRDKHNSAGLLAAEETAEWIWNQRFAAVAADNPTLEAWPPAGESQLLHEYLLPTLGCPIGELWDLKKLSAVCAKNKRYTFFLTSAPLNVSGAIATPANAIAIL